MSASYPVAPHDDPYEDDEDSVLSIVLLLGMLALLVWGCIAFAVRWSVAHADMGDAVCVTQQAGGVVCR
jgi:hypothetical protein